MSTTVAQLRALDVLADNGVPFRVILVPANVPGPRIHPEGSPYGPLTSDVDLAYFFDRRHPHTENGQHVTHYTVATLLGQDGWDRRIGEGRGLDLYGGEPAWKIDADTAAYVAAWLENGGRRPTPTPAQALANFLDTWTDVMGVGEHLTCMEADTLADLYRANHMSGSADALLLDHAGADDEGDSHYGLTEADLT